MLDWDTIYAKGGWDGLGSGPGSLPEYCRGYIEWLEKFMEEHGIKSVFDVGCGDWQFSKFVQWGDPVWGRRYVGLDGCAKVIEENIEKYGALGTEFYHADALWCAWEKADLVIVKDVLHHLTPEESHVIVARSTLYQHAIYVGPPDGEYSLEGVINRDDFAYMGRDSFQDYEFPLCKSTGQRKVVRVRSL